MSKQWTLRELAAETGVPERTIRFYISRELLPPPLKGGRGAAYGPAHKALLNTIKKLQAKGLMLVEIAHALAAVESGTDRRIVHRARLFGGEKEAGDVDRLALAAEIPLIEPVRTLPEPETWRSYAVAQDVVVMLRSGTSPWRTKMLFSALRRFAAQVEDENKKEGENE